MADGSAIIFRVCYFSKNSFGAGEGHLIDVALSLHRATYQWRLSLMVKFWLSPGRCGIWIWAFFRPSLHHRPSAAIRRLLIRINANCSPAPEEHLMA